MWASAYELDKLVQAYGVSQNLAGLTTEHREAVEEWVCMFVLYYAGVINEEIIDQREFVDREEVTSEYDPDLWPALANTYPPRAVKALSSMILLRMDDDDSHGYRGLLSAACFFSPVVVVRVGALAPPSDDTCSLTLTGCPGQGAQPS